MADSVVKLRIDSKEYDANIRRAGQALTEYFQKVREGGGTLMHLDECVMDAVKAMGEMGTQSSNTRGALRELTQATTDMTAAYRSLTDEERNSPLGQAMAQSIAQMTERAGQARDAMADVSAAISNAASDTRGFDQLAQGVSVVTATFQTAQGAAKLLGINLGDNVEVLAKLQAAMAVTNGLTQIQTAVQKQSALMQGVAAVQAKALAVAQDLQTKNTVAATVAQRVFNTVAKANPYVLLGSAIATVAASLALFSAASRKAQREEEELAQKAEEAAKRIEDQREAFVSASADAMNTASRISSLQVAYKQANDEASKTAILQQAQQEFRKLGIECKGVDDAQRLLIDHGSDIAEMLRLQGNAAAIAALRMDAYRQSFKMLLENGYDAQSASILAGYNKDVQALDQQLTGLQTRMQSLRGGLSAGGVTTGGNTGGKGNTPPPVDGSIDAQTAKVQALQKAWRAAADDSSRADIAEQLREAQAVLDQMQGKKVDIIPEGSMKALQKELQDLQAQQQLATDHKGWRDLAGQIENVQARMALLKGEIPSDKAVELTITADNAEALQAVQQLAGVTVDPKTLTITADNAEALQAVQQLAGVTVDPNTFTITADNAEALAAIQQVAGVTIDPKMLTITADNAEALQAVQQLAGVTVDPKTLTITADNAEALQAVQQLAGVTVDTKTLTITADNAEALAAIQQVAGITIDPKTVKIVPKVEMTEGISGMSSKAVSAYQSMMQDVLSGMDFTAPDYTATFANMIDAQTFGNVIQTALQQGVNIAATGIDVEGLWDNIVGGENIPDDVWQSLQDKINEQLEAMQLDPIKIDFQTGSVTKEAKKMNDDWKQAASAIQSVGAAMMSIEDPAAKVMGTIAQAIASIALGAGQAIAQAGNGSAGGPWGWIAFAAAATATMISTIASVKSATAGSYEQGGIVPGTSWHGDNLTANVNSGELILNRAQQNNLASQLQGSGMGNMNLSATISGEQLRLVLNNNSRRRGHGEYVTTNFR